MRSGIWVAGLALLAATAIAVGMSLRAPDTVPLQPALVEAGSGSSTPHADTPKPPEVQDEAPATAPAPRVVLTEPEPELLQDFVPEQQQAVREILSLYRQGEGKRAPIIRDFFRRSAALVEAEVVDVWPEGVAFRYRSAAPQLGIKAGDRQTMMLGDYPDVHQIKQRHGLLGNPELQKGSVHTVLITAYYKRMCPLAGPPRTSGR